MSRPAVALSLAGSLIVAAAGAAIAGTAPDGVSPEVVGPVDVETLNRSADRCWTNPEQVEDYAEERLRRNGFQVIPDERATSAPGSYVLYVGVIADRVNGTCSGTLQIFLAEPTWRDGAPGAHMVGPDTSRISAHRDADVHVLGKVRNFIERM